MGFNDKPEQLFLLEVLIDRIKLHEIPPETPIRVRIKFLEFPCFEITQDDLKQDEQKKDGDVNDCNFSSGKSHLFPMIPVELIRGLQRYPLAVTVFKVSPDAPAMPEIVGQTRVRMSEGMAEAVQLAMTCNCDNELPISHTLTDTFSLLNIGTEVGTITLFIRLSCFGQSIVTQFQLMGEKKAFLFKNSKADNQFHCKPDPTAATDADEPTKFDILTVAPFLTSEENVIDLYGNPCTDDPERPVAWKVNPCKPAPCPDCQPKNTCNRPSRPPCPPNNERPTNCKNRPPSRPPGSNNEQPSSCKNRPPTRPNCPPQPPPSGCKYKKNNPPPEPHPVGCNCGQEIRPPEPPPSLCGCGQEPPHPEPPPSLCGCGQEVSPPEPSCTCGTSHQPSSQPNPLIRYDTTGALSPAFQGYPPSPGCRCGDPEPRYCPPPEPSCSCGTSHQPASQPSPLIRYDTTGALSPAFQGYPPSPGCRCGDSAAVPDPIPACPSCCSCLCDLLCPIEETDWCVAYPPVAFQGCSCEPDPVEVNPPIRYDTTGALSPAYMGPPPEPSARCKCGGSDLDIHSSPQTSHRNSLGQGDGQDSPARVASYGVSPTGVVEHTSSNPEMGDRRRSSVKSTGSHNQESSGQQQQGPTSNKPSKHRKKRTKWTQKWGLEYPGIKFGHRFCIEKKVHVPPRMGWLWNLKKNNYGCKPRKGWRPGAIGAAVHKMINDNREAAGRSPLPVKGKSRWKSGRGGRGGNNMMGDQPPTLHIHRREGAYYISMHPLDLGPDAINVPLQFKIPKREREEGDLEPSSSEESELEIEFMAPGAFEERLPPPEFRSYGTQYVDLLAQKQSEAAMSKKGSKKDKKKKGKGKK